jgi:glycosyltransferase involved in cell wall biosynthesis
MIARNEEAHLVAAMQSAKRFADEVVLLDTGSTDRTVAVARSLGMKVYKFEWIHDFAAARNASFGKCRGRYIFWQDPDEVVPEKSALLLRDLAGEGLEQNIDEFRMLTALNGTYRPPEEDIPGYGPGFRVLKPRMLRNVPELSWVNRIHETTHWSRSIRRRDIGEEVWVHNHGNADGHDTATGDDYYYALMVLGHRDHPHNPHYSLYLGECAIVREANPAKAIQYLDTIPDPTKLGSPELEEKYWVMRGRAFKASAINGHDQGMDASGQAQTSMDCYTKAFHAKGSHAPTLEAATLVLYLGSRDSFRSIVEGVIADTPQNLMAQWFLKLVEIYEDPAELNQQVGNWLFALRNGKRSMEEAFAMVTQGQDPLQVADTEGAWDRGMDDVVIAIVARVREPERVRNLRACLRALSPQGCDVIVVEQDDPKQLDGADVYGAALVHWPDTGPFNRGRCFNMAAELTKARYICLMDADMLVDPLWLQRCLDNIAAAEKAGRFPGAMLPYSQAIYMDRATTEAAIAAGNPLELEEVRGDTWHSQGGCIWITAELYEQMGGHDERYVGWGSADRDFYQRLMAKIGGAPPRIDQPLFHMEHPKPDETNKAANAELYKAVHDISEKEGARQ